MSLSPDFLEHLEEEGLPRTIAAGIALPFGVNTPNEGWTDVESIEEAILLFEKSSLDFVG